MHWLLLDTYVICSNQIWPTLVVEDATETFQQTTKADDLCCDKRFKGYANKSGRFRFFSMF